MSATVAHRSIWRPWPALVVHASVVAVTIAAAVVAALLPTSAGMVALSRGAIPLLQLGLPLSDFLPFPAVGQGEVASLSSVAWLAVVPLCLLALHQAVVAAVRRDRRRRQVQAGPSAPWSSRPAPAMVAAVALSTGAGVACWVGWLALPGALGHQVPRTAGEPYGPSLAYVGAIATALVAAVVMARIARSISAPLGVSAGLWLAHAVWLFQQDSALWAFAALLALPVAAAVGALATTFSFATGLTGEMSPAAPLPPPSTGWVFSDEHSAQRRGTPAKAG